MSFTANSEGGKYKHQHRYGLLYGEYFGLRSRELKLLTYDKKGESRWQIASSAGYQAQDTFNNGNPSAAAQSANQYVNYANTELQDNLQPYISVYFWRRTA